MKQFEERLLAGIGAMSPDAIMRNWMSFNPSNLGNVQNVWRLGGIK